MKIVEFFAGSRSIGNAAEKLGFKEIYISKFQQAQVPDRFKIKVHAEGKLEDVLKSFLK